MMTKFRNTVLRSTLAQARRWGSDNAGTTAPGMAFSLTGLGLAVLACLLFLDAGFNVHSSTFGNDLLRAIRLF